MQISKEKLIPNFKDYRLYLFIVILVTAAFDIYTTIPLVQYESNPLYLLFSGGGVLGIILIKIFAATLLCWLLWITPYVSEWRSFSHAVLVVLAIVVQVIAGYSNIELSSELPSDGAGHVTLEQKVDAGRQYFAFVGYFMAYPLLVALLAFGIHKLRGSVR